MSTKSKTKKVKSKISKLIEKSESENEEDNHELSYYVNDRVKLMKEVLKIIKPKKIKAMAPECIKDLDIEEINSMLLEELLGISNKRLKYIFNGQNPAEDSSSTEEEEDRAPIDIISLDDVSEDDFAINVDSDQAESSKKKKKTNQPVPKPKKIKKEKHDKKKVEEQLQEENLMSVLELLELQARARAIRSQLMLESSKKNSETPQTLKTEEDSDEEAVIIESPKNEEIVITSSDSESEQKESAKSEDNNDQPKKRIKLNRQKFNEGKNLNESLSAIVDDLVNQKEVPEEGELPENRTNSETVVKDTSEVTTEICSANSVQSQPIKRREEEGDDGVILIVDQDEIDNIIGVD